jgi:hypothetical protein
MRDASAQERIAALRRVREERRLTNTEETEARRRRRLTARLQDVFHIRTTGTSSSPPQSNHEGGASGTMSSPIERIAESPSEISPITTGPSTSTPPKTTSDWPVPIPKASAAAQGSTPLAAPSSSSPLPAVPVVAAPASPSAVALPPSPTDSNSKDHKADKS